MHVLRIEHDVASYEAWKDAFDSDPLGREAGGALGHRVFRASSDPNHVLIDLDFAEVGDADAFLARLRDLWGRVDVMKNPTAQVVEVVETAQY